MHFLKSKDREIFVVGGQAHNSSSYDVKIDEACLAVKKIGGNTIELPVYWENIEPQEGQFDFREVQEAYKKIEDNGLFIIFLWFGTWKNGTSKFVPVWVKQNKKRFFRVMGENGAQMSVISPHCKEAMQADARAFAAFMEFLKQLDKEKNIVLAVQVENEPGIMNGPVRDFGEAADDMFYDTLPQDMLDMMAAFPKSAVANCWNRNGHKTENWQQAYQGKAQEFFTAYATARYVEYVAAAGIREYENMTLYTNVWVENHRLKLPGKDYPSGGAVGFVLDIWKHTAKSLAFISPDNYQQTYEGYAECCDVYSREDNALFIPESGLLEWNSRFMFSAIADYKAIGINIFGVESVLQNGKIGEKEQAVAESMQVLGALGPGLVKYQDKPIRAIMQDEYAQYQYLEFENYIGIAYFSNCNSVVGRLGTDWNWHDYYHKDYLSRQINGGCRGRGIIIQSGEKEFYVAGDAFQLVLLPKEEEIPYYPLVGSDFHLTRSMDFITIEEGIFQENGEFKVQRKRNGDEADFGIWVEPDIQVVRVRLC